MLGNVIHPDDLPDAETLAKQEQKRRGIVETHRPRGPTPSSLVHKKHVKVRASNMDYLVSLSARFSRPRRG